MRILYQHRTLADGAEGIHIHEMIEAFEALGHEVVVEALAQAQAPGEGRPGIAARVKAALPPACFELAAQAYNAVDYVAFRRTIARERPALVYKRHAINDVGVALAAKRAGIPLVLEVNCPYSSPQHQRFEIVRFRRLARACERAAVNAATLVAAVSSPMADYLRTLASDPDRVIVVPNGANPSRFAPGRGRPDAVRQRFSLGDRIVIGWAGILREWHRVDLLLDALESLPDAHLLIVGDGPDRGRLEGLARARGLQHRIAVTGRVPHEEMPDYVAAFDIAVAADDRTGYASPMKLLEYMAMERPVVAPRMRNIEDFVSDGRDGLLFEPGNPNSLAEALRRLAGDTALRQRLASAGRRKIEQDRNWHHNARIVLDEVGRRAGWSVAPQNSEIHA